MVRIICTSLFLFLFTLGFSQKNTTEENTVPVEEHEDNAESSSGHSDQCINCRIDDEKELRRAAKSAIKKKRKSTKRKDRDKDFISKEKEKRRAASKKIRQLRREKGTISDADLDSLIQKEKFSIQVFGDGNFQESLEGEEGIPINTGAGILAIKRFGEKHHFSFLGMYEFRLEASINVASTVDTLSVESLIPNRDNWFFSSNTSDFGNSILTPLNSGQALNLDITGLNKWTYLGFISGFRFQYTGSNRMWSMQPDNEQSAIILGNPDLGLSDDLEEIPAYLLSTQITAHRLRIGIFHEFTPFDYREKYSAMFEISYAYNGLSGDLGLGRNNPIREIYLGTDERHYQGFDLGFNFRLQNIRAQFNYTYFISNDQVPGLSGGRLTTTIAFVGGFKAKLN